jgi:hypothetical protein
MSGTLKVLLTGLKRGIGMRRTGFSLLLAVGYVLPSFGQGSGGFVGVSNGALTLNQAPFRFGGTNSYALMLESQAVVDQVLETAAANHFTGLRMWGFDEVSSTSGYPFTCRISPAARRNITTAPTAWPTWTTPSTRPANSASSSS